MKIFSPNLLNFFYLDIEKLIWSKKEKGNMSITYSQWTKSNLYLLEGVYYLCGDNSKKENIFTFFIIISINTLYFLKINIYIKIISVHSTGDNTSLDLKNNQNKYLMNFN